MVDAVITWVNGNDPAHQAEMERYRSDATQPEWAGGALDATRFNERGELWYCVNLIRKNATWIDEIFIVTDDQRPLWLTNEIQSRLNITIIDHSAIFQGYENHLPTFNSLSIETLLHKIPRLGARYLYFNDDFFLVNRSKESDYFDGDRPIIRGAWRRSSEFKRTIMQSPLRKVFRYFYPDYYSYGYMKRRAESKLLPEYRSRFFLMAHAPFPVTKSVANQALSSDVLIESNVQYRFRSDKQFNPAALMAHVGFSERQSLAGPHDWEYIDAGGDSIKTIVKRLKRCGASSTIKSLCVQSLDLAKPDALENINRFLESRL